jgi:hypothetical protein
MRRREFLFTGAIPFIKPAAQNSCILLQLTGGPSHLDTWDPKPDAPSGIRSPFKPIRTNVPGILISGLFPRMARCADKYALIRSVHGAGHFVSVAQASACGLSFRTRCIDAVKQIENGARFVTVPMFRSVFDEPTWDMHGWGPFSTMQDYRDIVAPVFDIAFTDLLEELTRRGLFENTLVVAMGEFGRTPRLNPSGGRDHWPHCYTVIMAGAGIEGGWIYGSSDAIGAEPRDRPVSVSMVREIIDNALLNADRPAATCLSVPAVFRRSNHNFSLAARLRSPMHNE